MTEIPWIAGECSPVEFTEAELAEMRADSDALRIKEREDKLSRLKKLSAMAINHLCGGTIFDVKVDGKFLRNLAVKEGLFEFDALHHAPACPANHFHEMRLPTGKCSCGAEPAVTLKTSN